MQNMTDLELVTECGNGNTLAFEVLLGRYSDKAYNLALRVTRSMEDAEEVVQDAFVTVFNKIGSFKGESQFSSWFYRIAMNCALMKLRVRRRHPQTTSEIDANEHSNNVCDLGYMSNRAELQGKLQDAIEKLPDVYKEIFILRDIEGISNEEASQILNVSVTALKSRLHRARLMLRKALKCVYRDYTGVSEVALQELLAA